MEILSNNHEHLFHSVNLIFNYKAIKCFLARAWWYPVCSHCNTVSSEQINRTVPTVKAEEDFKAELIFSCKLISLLVSHLR